MIKKSLFENELIHGMQRELHSHEKKQGMNSLVQAVEYLHSAAQIFEEAGMTAKAEQVLQILSKIAAQHDTKVKMMPSMQSLMENGVTQADLKGLGKGDAFSKARVNTAFRRLGYTDKEIASFIGRHNLMSEEEAAELMNPEGSPQRFMSWIENPMAPIDPNRPSESENFQQNVSQWMANPGPVGVQPGQEIEMQSLLKQPKQDDKPSPDELVFKSIAQELGLDDNDVRGKPHKPKNPLSVSDWHTKGLTPEKMVENLKHHGTEFNMADDNNIDVPQPKSFDEFYNKWKAHKMMEEGIEEPPPTVRQPSSRPKPRPDFGDLEGLIVMDDAQSDDILNAEIDEKPSSIHDGSSGETFEDSD
jgi:hypothetical protein